MCRRDHARRVRGFTLIEVLVAIAITGLMMGAVMVALDTCFKGYKVTTEQSATNMMARLTMQRISSLVRNAKDFAPYPNDVLDLTQNPVKSTRIEITTPLGTSGRQVSIFERRSAAGAAGPFQLWYVRKDFNGNTEVLSEERPILSGVLAVTFTLQYSAGPRLGRATIDLTVKANEFQDASVSTTLKVPPIRLVSTAVPRTEWTDEVSN
jgi:prepilin-type N-terminal cleavage/methylation domain-containing protein